MKKILKNVFIIIFIALILPLHVQAVQKQIIVGVSAEYPPFVFVNNGRIVGFDVDLITTIADDLKYDVRFQDMEFQELFTALENKQVDVAVTAISTTDERRKLVSFSSSYYFPELAVLVMKQSNITSLDDLQGKTIGIISQTAMQQFFTTRLNMRKQMKVKPFTHMDFMIKALTEGKIDAILTEDAIAKQEHNTIVQLAYFILKESGYSDAYRYAIALQKDSNLVEPVNNTLLKLKVSGQLTVLKEKWGI